MAVDQAGRDRGAVGVDKGGGAFGIDVPGTSDRGDLAVLGHDGVGVEDRLFQGAAQQQADIADHQLARAGGLGFIVGHGFFLLVQCLRKVEAPSCARLDGGIKPDYSFVCK